MQNVLADLAVESEAATALAIRLAAAVDAGESAFLRLAGAAAKFWVCKRTPTAVAEALEGLGGNGYVERSEEHTSEIQSRQYLVCRLLLEKKKTQETRPRPRK